MRRTRFDDLREGQAVTFERGQGPKGPRGENVRVVETVPALNGKGPGTHRAFFVYCAPSGTAVVACRGMTITRREMLSGLLATGAGLTLPGRSLAATPNSELRVDAGRLRQSLEALSVYGRPAGGTFADGVSRTAYSDADIAGRRFAMDLMRAAGLEPRIDTAANIFATRAGTDPTLKPILFGSHIDSVPSGGNFDGDLGSLSAIEAVRTLHDQGVATRHPLQVVIWSNEEGGTIGSRAAVGDLDAGGPRAVVQRLHAR